MTIAIIDYGSGNLRSAEKAFERAVAELGLGRRVIVTDDCDAVAKAEQIVLPGVGAFADCMAGLAAVDGMLAALSEAVVEKARPFLGICVGMQLMAAYGREYGVTEGLGWIPGDVVRITPDDPALKIPHMGWNTLEPTEAGEAHPLLNGMAGEDVYFVHSFQLDANDPGDVLATTDYAGPINAVVGRDNMVGTQFHPEKSQRVGLAIIKNFLTWRPGG